MSNQSSYSADVRQYLVLDGQRLDVGQCVGNRCFLRQSIDHPPCDAELVIVVDGAERRTQVFLDQGLSRTSTWVQYSAPVAAG